MANLSGFQFFPLQITKKGAVFDAAEKKAIVTAITAAGPNRITDLFVVSHGWNNDMEDAKKLYTDMFSSAAALLTGPRGTAAANRRIAIVGVLWPSKKFADEEVIPGGGAASIGSGASAGKRVVTSAGLKKKLDGLKGTFDRADGKALASAKALVDKLETDPKAREKFVDLIRSVLPKPTDKRDDASDQFFRRKGVAILESLKAPIVEQQAMPTGTGGAAGLTLNTPGGSTAGLGDIFSGIQAAAWRLLNYATFYQMKERAGVVGDGLNGVLKEIRAARSDLRLHLVGHSFGARVVTAAAAGTAKVKPASMALLQGAFSHNGFTEKFDGTRDGFFRNVVTDRRIDGPILATHTVNDKAVGLAYPLAVRISGDNRLAIGDENDVFGGIGRNGAVKMKANEFVSGRLLPVTQAYALQAGKVNNLKADAFIADHNNVQGRECAHAFLSGAGF